MKKTIFLLLLPTLWGWLLLPAQSSDTLRIVHHNLLNFGLSCNGEPLSERYNRLGEVLDFIRPDVFTVNEVAPNKLLFDGIVALGFSYSNQIAYGGWTNQVGSNIVNQLFFNSEKLEYKRVEVIPSSHLRDLNAYTLYHKASTLPGDTTFLTFIVCHLKAGDGSSNETQRNAAANAIMDWVSLQDLDRPTFLLGDFNIGAASETAFQIFVNHPDPDIRFLDPINKETGWGGFANAIHHTQSTRNSSGGTCGSGGGMDDRFDMILANSAVLTGNGPVSYVPDSYEAVGNDGNSYNTELQCSGNSTVPGQTCVALRDLSDHLPVSLRVAISSTVGRESLWNGPDLRLLDQSEQGNLGLQLSTSAPTTFALRLLDIQGRTLQQGVIPRGSTRISLPVSQLPQGLYLIQVVDANGRFLTLKWQKRI